MTIQRNVQQQNVLVEMSIRREAVYWREHKIPEALHTVGQERGIQWNRSIIINLDINFPGMPTLSGLLLTQDEKFLDFEIEVSSDRYIVEIWSDVTMKQNINHHNLGIGAGYGAIAVKILRELNA